MGNFQNFSALEFQDSEHPENSVVDSIESEGWVLEAESLKNNGSEKSSNFHRSIQKNNTSWWFQLSTHLKNISQIGSFLQVGVKIKIFETTT